jgi:hypothetical protein
MYTMMPFGLKIASKVFSRIMVKSIHDFLDAYLDDWTVYGLV